MARTKDRSDEQVLQAALGVIAQRGPLAFTLAQVGEACGLAPATLLQRFGSKQGLLRQALEHSQRARPLAPPDPGGDPLRQALDLLRREAEGFGDAAQMGQHLALLRKDLADPQLRRLARAHLGRLQAGLKACLLRAQRQGLLRQGVEPGPLAEALLAQWNGAVILWALRRQGRLAEQAEKSVSAVLDLARKGR